MASVDIYPRINWNVVSTAISVGNLNSLDEGIYKNNVAIRTLCEETDAIAESLNIVSTNLTKIGSMLGEMHKLNAGSLGKLIITGDSFTAGFGLEDTNNNWAMKFVQLAGVNSSNYKIIANSGGGFITKGSWTGKSYEEHIVDTILPQIEKPNEIDTFIIQGGLNDGVKTYQEMYTAVKSCITTVKTYFANAKIIVLPMLNYRLCDKNTYRGLIDACNDELVFYPKLAYTWLIFRNDLMQTDNKHPNNDGALFIAKMMYRFVSTGRDDVYYEYIFTGSNSERIIFAVNGEQIDIKGYGTTPGESNNRVMGQLPADGVYWAYNESIPIYSNMTSTCFMYMHERDVCIFTPGKAGSIGWRVLATIPIPFWNSLS